MGQALREIPVVGQDEEAFGLRVKPADIEKARELRWKEIENRVACIGIGVGRNKAGRFVQDEVELAFTAHQLASDLDVITLRRLCAEVRADTAVNSDATGGDQFFAMPPRTDTSGGEKTIQAHGKKLRVSS